MIYHFGISPRGSSYTTGERGGGGKEGGGESCRQSGAGSKLIRKLIIKELSLSRGRAVNLSYVAFAHNGGTTTTARRSLARSLALSAFISSRLYIALLRCASPANAGVTSRVRRRRRLRRGQRSRVESARDAARPVSTPPRRHVARRGAA